MSYIDRLLRTERQYERFDDLTTYTGKFEDLLELAGSVFPQHAQQLEAMLREAASAKNAARHEIEGDA